MSIPSDFEGTPSGSTGAPVMDAVAVIDERRSSQRARRNVTMKLRAVGCADLHCCIARDISEGGLYVCVPADHGLTVGRRDEVAFADDAEAPSFAGATYYATVVRTNAAPLRGAVVVSNRGHAAEDLIGAALRFDRPLFLDLVTALDEPRVSTRAEIRAG